MNLRWKLIIGKDSSYKFHWLLICNYFNNQWCVFAPFLWMTLYKYLYFSYPSRYTVHRVWMSRNNKTSIIHSIQRFYEGFIPSKYFETLLKSRSWNVYFDFFVFLKKINQGSYEVVEKYNAKYWQKIISTKSVKTYLWSC